MMCASISTDGGKTWTTQNTADRAVLSRGSRQRFPYHIYARAAGHQQRRASPSRTGFGNDRTRRLVCSRRWRMRVSSCPIARLAISIQTARATPFATTKPKRRFRILVRCRSIVRTWPVDLAHRFPMVSPLMLSPLTRSAYHPRMRFQMKRSGKAGLNQRRFKRKQIHNGETHWKRWARSTAPCRNIERHRTNILKPPLVLS